MHKKLHTYYGPPHVYLCFFQNTKLGTVAIQFNPLQMSCITFIAPTINQNKYEGRTVLLTNHLIIRTHRRVYSHSFLTLSTKVR